MPSAPETENDAAGSEGNTPDSDPAAEAAWEQEARCETRFFHLEVLSETVEAKTVETLERGTESATEGSKQENTEENNKETASESKQTEEETKQTEAETSTEECNTEKAPSKEAVEKEATEEIQQDGSLYDMGGEMRKASRVAKVGLRKAAGGLDSNYVYLDPEGMNLNFSADWSKATQLYLFKTADGDKFTPGEKVNVYGKYYWRWRIDGKSNNFAFTYKDKWPEIKQDDYYRTELAGKSSSSAAISFSAAGGKVFANFSEEYSVYDGKKAYVLKDITAEIANKMPLYFYDFTGDVKTPVKVVYSSGSSFSTETEGATKSVEMNSVNDFPNLYTVELEKAKIETNPYVKFTDGDGKPLGKSYYFGQDSTGADTSAVPVTYKAGSVDTFLYGATELQNDDGTTTTTISDWGTTPGNESLKDKTLYFDNQHFPVKEGEEKVTLQIGTGTAQELIPDPQFKDSLYSYKFTEDTTQQTVFTVKDPQGNTYHFFWTDLDCNLLQVTENIANVTGEYGYGNKIYFDATYSKLNTPDVENSGQNSIPASDNDKVYFYAWNSKDSSKVRYGAMIKAKPHKKDGQTWSDVWYVRIPEEDKIDQIIFSDVALENSKEWDHKYGRRTAILTIPNTKECGGKPCFYADAGDATVYEDKYRDGYWAEVYTIRDAEKYKVNKDVVDIQKSASSTDQDTLYVDSTFYDYYTDYELNGNNRDSFSDPSGMSQRNWVPFRQFDQALSDYYEKNQVSVPIYTGHFQPSIDKWGCQFKDINGTLKLYGSDNNEAFFSTNNSVIVENGSDKGEYDYAAQGLVSSTLTNGVLKTAGGECAEPHFDEAFLLGKNSKNAVLGEVYHNVSFPFKKKEDSNGVEYWWFDSSKTTLAMQKDLSTQKYYLKNTENQSWARNVKSDGKDAGAYGFFPFNETTGGTNAAKYNFGFGTKLEIKFRLTEEGTVLGNNKTPVPIIFAFSGDDDVWVFIDGKLALDVGGAHGKVTGTLNFKNLEATVSKVKKSAAGIEGASPKTTKFTLEGANEAEHTLTMFYMERGMWESNMMIAFNFPNDNEFAVEKQVDKSGVNPLFADSFEDASVFPFTIQNQATHFGTKKAADSEATVKKEPFNRFDSGSSVSKPENSDITFELQNDKNGQSGVAHWFAPLDDAGGENKEKRYGIIPYQPGGTLNASTENKYLEFKLYYDYADTPTAKCIYLELEDASRNQIGGLLSGMLYGNTTLKGQAWNTLTVDLSKLKGTADFDYNHIKCIKFNYSYSRHIYLDDFVFRSGVQVTKYTGFEVNQKDIPDYGSATSGKLENPKGAVYSLSDSSSTDTGVIEEDGTFVLADGQTATFRNQFRRGSYISVKEEIDSPAFETRWSLYENGHAVGKVTGTGDTVTITPGQSVSNEPGMQIKDGRKEVHKEDGTQNTGYTVTQFAKDANGSTQDTIVFRSYSNPDDKNNATKLKAVFVNKVKVGSLKIQKEKAKGSDDLEGTYTFKIKFTNVAGMSLEKGDSITTEIPLKQGESYTISGIPIGTDYEITEVKPTDGSSLKKVLISNDGTTFIDDTSFNVEKGSVNGTITAETAENPVVEFQNNNKPTGNIAVTKKWVTTNGTEITDLKQLPTSIYLQLQRKEKGKEGAAWQAVDYSGNIDNSIGKKWVVVTRTYGGWSYSFMDLEQYVDSAATDKVPWIYRVMEVDADGNVIASGGTYTVDGKTYRVAYSLDASTGKTTGSMADPATGTATDLTKVGIELATFATADVKQPTVNMTVTNTYLEELNLKITKKGKNTTEGEGLLSGVEFKLEKKNGEYYEPFLGPLTTVEGIATFEKLGQGTYRLIETKAAKDYNLLSDSILIEIDASNRVKWKMEKEPEEKWMTISPNEKNEILLTIYNTKQLILPATGGSGFGLVTMGGIALMAQAILMGTYFTLQCRKGDDKLRKKR